MSLLSKSESILPSAIVFSNQSCNESMAIDIWFCRSNCGIGTGYCAHDLLDRHKKILVLGATSVGDDILQAIAKKDYGFSKNDFETDYEKITNAAGRLLNLKS